MKKAIVSFSSQGRDNYNKAMLNLIRSCKDNWDGDLLMYQFDGYIDEYLGIKIEQGKSLYYPQTKRFQCYNHAEVPYQFKLAMMQKAVEAGYEQVIWCDSTVRVIKNPAPLLELAAQQGVVVFDNLGHPLHRFISDHACSKLGINTRSAAFMTLPQIMACVLIFDFSNMVACEIFEEWIKHSQDGFSFQNYGSNRPDFISHRHDQAVLSYLIHKRKILFRSYGELVYPPHDATKEYGENIYFVNKGIN